MLQRFLPMVLLAAVATGAPDTRAATVYTYSYGTVLLTPQGRVTGSLVTTDAYVRDGILSAEELTPNFTLSDTAAPFAAAAFTPAEFAELIDTVHNGEIYVDRVSGEIYSGNFTWRASDLSTGQTLSVSTDRVRVQSGSPAQFAEAAALLTVSGGGTGAVSGGPGGGPGADITYTYETTTAAPQAGAIRGSFVVPKSAIADGLLSFDEITSANFVLPDATAPYTQTTFTLVDLGPRFWTPRDTGSIRVDPVTGVFLHDFMLPANYPGGSRKALELFPHRYEVWRPDGLNWTRGVAQFVVSGGGSVSGALPVALPALRLPALAMLALLLVLFAAGWPRARQR